MSEPKLKHNHLMFGRVSYECPRCLETLETTKEAIRFINAEIPDLECWTCGNRNLRTRIAADLASYGYTRAKQSRPVRLSAQAAIQCRAAGHDVREVSK